MTNYLTACINHHSNKSTALDCSHNDVLSVSDANHKKEINNLKHDLNSSPTLKYYDVTMPHTLTCDESIQEFGAACL